MGQAYNYIFKGKGPSKLYPIKACHEAHWLDVMISCTSHIVWKYYLRFSGRECMLWRSKVAEKPTQSFDIEPISLLPNSLTFNWQTISDLDTDHWLKDPVFISPHLLSSSIFILVCFVMSLLALIEIEYVRFLAFGVHGFPRSDCKDFPALTLAARKAEHIDFLHRDTASILGIILIMCSKHSLGILHNLIDPPSTFITNLTASTFFEQVLLSAVELNIRRVQLRRNELKTAAH